MKCWNPILIVAVLFLSASAGAEQLQILSPGSVGQQLKQDRSLTEAVDSAFQSYDQWKADFIERTGFNYGIDYNALYYRASSSPTEEDESSSGVIRFYANWDLVGRNTPDKGSLVVKLEHRHAFTDVAPVDFGFELGYVGLLHSTFSDQGVHATNLYWKQLFDNKRILVFAGFMDVTDYVDVHLLASPWTDFSNLVFATGSGTIGALPDGSLGVMAGGWLNDNLYLSAGIADANADPAHLFEGFKSFFEDFETFKSVELGWTSGRDQFFFNNVHLTLWQVDARKEAQTPSGWGVAVSTSITHHENWMSFVRGGYSHDGNALLEGAVSLGAAHYLQSRKDVFGIAVNWGRPNHFDYPDARDQWTLESYYLFQLGKHLQVTPNLQVLLHPALSTERDSNVIVGVRARVVF